ncbi:hypothetical protein [Actinopolyspora xinjiangensis]|uniref:hypothetical protein n=1 Tax=Actinopolyspora xinjiangensis TaxID=405564 RepID=UPI001FCDF5AF|nr:hypothetical protein [Actinopolyspora xinjiangensis]
MLGQSGVLRFAEPYDLGGELPVQELIKRLAQVHSPDANTDHPPAVAISVQAQTVEALLAVGAVVEPTSGTRVRQARGAQTLERDVPTVGHAVLGAGTGHARCDVVRYGDRTSFGENALDRGY